MQMCSHTGVDMSSHASFMRHTDGDNFLKTDNAFGVEKFSLRLRCAKDPLTMQVSLLQKSHLSRFFGRSLL